jgi:5'-methylthioadenosine phosphorylase
MKILIALIALTIPGMTFLDAAETDESPSPAAKDPPAASIAVIGGTYLNDAMIDSPYLKVDFTIETRAGTSPSIHYGEVEGTPFYYIHGHGGGKWVETFAALYELGVKEIIGGATAGGINTYLRTYDLVLPDELIDLNINRKTYIVPAVMGPDARVTARMSPSTDPLLRNILLEEGRRVLRSRPELDDVNIHDRGVLVQARGGRFESSAEIRFMKSIGGDLVTLNNGTEMSYARQLGINYACLNLISNPAEGIGPWEWSGLKNVYQRLNLVCLDIVVSAIPRIAAIGDIPREMDHLLRMKQNFTYKKNPEEADNKLPFAVE